MTALAFALRYWKLIAAGLITTALVLALLFARHDAAHWKAKQAATQTAFDQTVANYRAASAKAIADNIADVRAKEGDASIITEKANHDLQSQLADARALAADYARRMRAASAANSGSAGQAGIGEATGSPGSPHDAGMPFMADDDLRICSENTVKVKGWIDWYASLRTRYNAE